MSCCVECHFAWEERVVWPLLPAEVRVQLAAEHASLRSYHARRGRWPGEALLQHADREDRIFARFAPGAARRAAREHATIGSRVRTALG